MRLKRWPLERFTEVGIKLAQDINAKILLFGSKADNSICDTIAHAINTKSGDERATNMSGLFSLLETASAMKHCDIIITNDSGLMHIATAMKKKVVAIFGSTVREFGFFPVGTGNLIIERNGLYCRPCSHIGRDECPEGHFRCMTENKVDEVIEAIRGFLHLIDR